VCGPYMGGLSKMFLQKLRVSLICFYVSLCLGVCVYERERETKLALLLTYL
jgi:hypothetical protein